MDEGEDDFVEAVEAEEDGYDPGIRIMKKSSASDSGDVPRLRIMKKATANALGLRLMRRGDNDEAPRLRIMKKNAKQDDQEPLRLRIMRRDQEAGVSRLRIMKRVRHVCFDILVSDQHWESFQDVMARLRLMKRAGANADPNDVMKTLRVMRSDNSLNDRLRIRVNLDSESVVNDKLFNSKL